MISKPFAIIILSILLPLLLFIPSQAATNTTQEELTNLYNINSSGLMFVENVGQFDARVRFQVNDGNKTVRITDDSIWITLLEPAGNLTHEKHHYELGDLDPTSGRIAKQETQQRKAVNLRLGFAGANLSGLEPFGQLETHINYYLGNDPSKWSISTPVWSGVRCKNLYPGVDLEITGDNGKWDWKLVAQSLPTNVKLNVEGADSLELDDGQLLLNTSAGNLTLPLLTVEGVKPNDSTAPTIEMVESIKEGYQSINLVHPFLDPYKSDTPSLRTPQDNPSSLVFSTFIGGSGGESGLELVLDKNDNIIICGHTTSTNFPSTPGAFDANPNGGNDILVSKLSANGKSLLFSTFVGGSNHDFQSDLVIDKAGNVAINGTTESSNFPTTSGAFDRSYNGWEDIILFKLAASNGSVLFSTYLGGNDDDDGSKPMFDDDGNIIIAGQTFSSNFPTTTGSFDPSHNGSSDAFVLKLSSNGSTLLYSTFVGGSDAETAVTMTMDETGNTIVTGYTYSANFPTTAGAYDPSHNGNTDIFCFKLSSNGKSLLFSTLVGGDGLDYSDYIQAPVLDSDGNVLVTGLAQSDDFPTTAGAYDTSYNSSGDVFVFKLANDGKSLLFSTFVGGYKSDFETALALDENENVVVMGYTKSPDFPTTSRAFSRNYDETNYDNIDVFVFKLGSTGQDLIFSTRLGGGREDTSYVMALDQAGDITLTGYTESSDFPTTAGAFDTSYNDDYDVFISKLAADGEFLRYSTFLGGNGDETSYAIGINSSGQVVVTGNTESSNFPTTAGAIDTSHNGGYDAFVSKLNPESKPSIFQKQVTPSSSFSVSYGQVLTYTVNIGYPYDSDVVFYDRVPTHTIYMTNSLTAPAGVFYDPNTGVISGTMNMIKNNPVTISFAASVQVTGTKELAPTIKNSACVFPVGAQLKYCDWSNEVINFTYIWPAYLPLVSRQ